MSTVRVIVSLVLALAAAGVAGCDGDSDRPAKVSSPIPGRTAAAGCERPDMGPVEAGSILVPGPSNGLPRSTARGEEMVIDAVVFDAACRRVAGANLSIWHTDSRGNYRPPGTEACCYYQGTVRTDANGRFRLASIRPARYPQPGAPPAHIHLEIRHGSAEFTTEIVFADTVARLSVPGARQVPVSLTRDSGGPWRGEVALVVGE
jgi:protocatechuate 3,4-dioxygenase beta subunit